MQLSLWTDGFETPLRLATQGTPTRNTSLQEGTPHQERSVPDPPEGLSYAEALRDPTLLPFATRQRAARAMLEAGEIDGWQALAFTIYGIVAVAMDDDEFHESATAVHVLDTN